MYILNQNGNVLIDSNHVANFYIYEFTKYGDSKPSEWTIRAEYSMANNDAALFDVVAFYHNKEECKLRFNNLIHALIEDRKFYNFFKEE